MRKSCVDCERSYQLLHLLQDGRCSSCAHRRRTFLAGAEAAVRASVRQCENATQLVHSNPDFLGWYNEQEDVDAAIEAEVARVRKELSNGG